MLRNLGSTRRVASLSRVYDLRVGTTNAQAIAIQDTISFLSLGETSTLID